MKKPKNAAVGLSFDTVSARLRTNNVNLEPYPIDLERDILEVTTRRDFMSQADAYGGNMQETYPTIPKPTFKRTGLRDFMYLSLLCNPDAPEMPGAPGLLFNAVCADWFGEEKKIKREQGVNEEEDGRGEDEDEDAEEEQEEPGDEEADSRHEEDYSSDEQDISNDEDEEEEEEERDEEEEEDGGKRKRKREEEDKKPDIVPDVPEPDGSILFSRLDQGVWQYQGQYVMADAAPLTVAEWKQQPLKVCMSNFVPYDLRQLNRSDKPGRVSFPRRAGDSIFAPISRFDVALDESLPAQRGTQPRVPATNSSTSLQMKYTARSIVGKRYVHSPRLLSYTCLTEDWDRSRSLWLLR